MREEGFWKLHRVVMMAIAIVAVTAMATTMNWSWLPNTVRTFFMRSG